MNKTVKLMLAAACLATGGAVAETETPTAYVRELAGRTVTTDDGAVTLDTAYCFNAWDGAKPAYENLVAYLTEKGDAVRLAYLGWVADFVISFDRPVPAGAIELYGQANVLGENWAKFSLPDFAANDKVRLLNMNDMVYGVILDMVVRFNCGARAAKPEAYGTTMTVELRLYNPDNAEESVVCGRFSHRFVKPLVPNWFDANIAQYVQWPKDAALATGGQWQSGEPLEDVAAVKEAGVLSVDADALELVADRSRTLGQSADRAFFSADMDFGVNEQDALPKVDPAWKGGVIRVKEAEGEAYYGLAKDGDVNVWKKLDGPAPTGGIVRFAMTIRRKAGQPVANYTINGVAYTLNGTKNIPVAVSGAVTGVSLGGTGTLTSLSAATETAMVINVK